MPIKHSFSSMSALTQAWYFWNSTVQSLPAPFMIHSTPPG